MTDRQSTNATDSDTVSRRTVVKSTAMATGLLAGIGLTETVAAQQTTFRLGGKIAGWMGRSPSSIKGKTNPTLEMQAGKTYKIWWKNLDGAPHNVVIEDANGNNLVRTKIITGKGSTQSVTFTASTKMAEYYCEVHPQSMRGNVSISGGGANETETPTTTATPTETETPTPTTTATSTKTPTPAETTTPTATPTKAPTETATATPNATATTTPNKTTVGPLERDEKTGAPPLMADEACPEEGGNMSQSNKTAVGALKRDEKTGAPPSMADEACGKTAGKETQTGKTQGGGQGQTSTPTVPTSGVPEGSLSEDDKTILRLFLKLVRILTGTEKGS
jgi:hypothetical protein